MKLPRGFGFHLSHQESLFYLKNKVCGNPLPYDDEGVILERNPYDVKQLPDMFLAAETERGDLYFFTKLRRKGKVGPKMINGSVGKGSWRCDSKEELGNEHGPIIGQVRNLSYWEIGSENHKRYSMTEYVLSADHQDMLVPYDQFKDWVLCRLSLKKRWKDDEKESRRVS